MVTQYSQDWQLEKKTVLERNSHMLNNPLMSDVVFRCGESHKQFYAHRYVLATSSPVFYAMFYGNLAETSDVIHVCDADDDSFKEFLRFLYTDQCTPTPEVAVSVMYLAKKYMIPSLNEKCLKIIENGIKLENVMAVLEQAMYFDETDLEKKCWEIVEAQTKQVMTSEAFNSISQATLKALLKRKRLNIPEEKLFQAVSIWSDNQCSFKGLEATAKNKRAEVGDAISEIRFLSMTIDEFTEHVSPSGLLTSEELDAISGKLNGLDTAALMWKTPTRQGSIVRFARYSVCNVTFGWGYSACADGLSFIVSRKSAFRGVRLFGDDKGSRYKVTLDVNGVKLTGTYTSECNNEGVYGFDVMMPQPIAVNKNDIVKMIATIKGPNSFQGNAGKRTVEVSGVTLTFGNTPESTNCTNVTRGQFYEVILSI